MNNISGKSVIDIGSLNLVLIDFLDRFCIFVNVVEEELSITFLLTEIF